MKYFLIRLYLSVFVFSLSTEITKGGNIMFEGKTDIGKIKFPGWIKYDAVNNTIQITGSGENIWGKEDAFYFVWNKAEGDLSLKMKYDWIGKGKHEHRKAGWMIRAELEPDAPYVDAVVHGDGLISMQYRSVKGGETFEVQSAIKGNKSLLFERTGNQFTMYVVGENNLLHPAGTVSVDLPEHM